MLPFGEPHPVEATREPVRQDRSAKCAGLRLQWAGELLIIGGLVVVLLLLFRSWGLPGPDGTIYLGTDNQTPRHTGVLPFHSLSVAAEAGTMLARRTACRLELRDLRTGALIVDHVPLGAPECTIQLAEQSADGRIIMAVCNGSLLRFCHAGNPSRQALAPFLPRRLHRNQPLPGWRTRRLGP